MAYKTIYARITPINGVSGEKYSVTVSGITAIVDGQKTWSGGAMNFAITPTSAGTMTVTFKNDTLNQIIGTRTVMIGDLKYSGASTFTVGSYTLGTDVYEIGYIDYPNASPKVGVKLNDDLKINNQLINMLSCYILNVTASSEVSLFFSVNNPNIINETAGIIIKLTNLSNNVTYEGSEVELVSLGGGDNTGTWSFGIRESRASQVAALRSIMTVGTNVKVEILLI